MWPRLNWEYLSLPHNRKHFLTSRTYRSVETTMLLLPVFSLCVNSSGKITVILAGGPCGCCCPPRRCVPRPAGGMEQGREDCVLWWWRLTTTRGETGSHKGTHWFRKLDVVPACAPSFSSVRFLLRKSFSLFLPLRRWESSRNQLLTWERASIGSKCKYIIHI